MSDNILGSLSEINPSFSVFILYIIRRRGSCIRDTIRYPGRGNISASSEFYSVVVGFFLSLNACMIFFQIPLTSGIQILLDYPNPQHVFLTSYCAPLLWVPRIRLVIFLPQPESENITIKWTFNLIAKILI